MKMSNSLVGKTNRRL